MHTMHVDLSELTNSSPSICGFSHVHVLAQTVGKQIRNCLYQGELLRERLFLSFVFILKQTFKILLTPDDSLTIKAFLFVCLFISFYRRSRKLHLSSSGASMSFQTRREGNKRQKKGLGASFNIQKQRVTAIWHFDRMDQLPSCSSFFLFNLQG